MGHLKDIANQPKLQTFPNSQFEIAGDVPGTQCTDPLIGADDATTQTGPSPRLNDPGAFAGHNLAGRICTITASVGGNTGEFDIFSNSDDRLNLIQDPGDGNPVTYYIHDGASFLVTRNIQSFAEFIDAAGYTYTIKGGKLYTNIPTAELQKACRLIFAPLT